MHGEHRNPGAPTYFRIADQLTSEEFDYLRRAREFVDGEVLGAWTTVR